MTFYYSNTAAPSADFPGFTVAQVSNNDNWGAEITHNGLVSGPTSAAGDTYFRTTDANGDHTDAIGTGITTSGGNVTGGTITAIYRYNPTTGHWTGEGITGLNVSAAAFWNAGGGLASWDVLLAGGDTFEVDQYELTNAGAGYALDAGTGGGTKLINEFGLTTDSLTYSFTAGGQALIDNTTGRTIALKNFNIYEGDAAPDLFRFSTQIAGSNTLEGQFATNSGIADMNESIAGGSSAYLDLSGQSLEGFGTAEFTDTKTSSGTASATMVLNAAQFGVFPGISSNLQVKGDTSGINDDLIVSMKTGTSFLNLEGLNFDSNWMSNPSNLLYVDASLNTGAVTIDGRGVNEGIYGGTGNNSIYAETGTGSSSVWNGNGSGQSVLESNTAAGGVSYMYGGGTGAVTMIAGAGNDVLNANTTSTSARDYLEGGSGTVAMYGGAGYNAFYAGTGRALMGGGPGTNQYFLGSETVGDVVVGGSGSNYIYGGAGGDLLEGGPGYNVIDAGTGNQTLYGDGTSDTLFAGSGADWLYANTSSPTSFATMIGGTGEATMYGGAGTNDFFAGSGTTTMIGGSGSNIYTLGSTAAAGDQIHGGSGYNDVLGSQDTAGFWFIGGSGGGEVFGGSGADTIESGAGGYLEAFGGAGANLFDVMSGDGWLAIEDWGANDRIDFAPSTLLHSFAQVQAASTYDLGTNTTTIAAGSGAFVQLAGVTPSQLTASEFSFS